MKTVSIDQVKERAEKGSPHFFDDDTIRFFKSRISETCYKIGTDIYFITSERGPNMPRKWTVRKCDLKGDINAVGDFQEYDNLMQARRAIKEIES